MRHIVKIGINIIITVLFACAHEEGFFPREVPLSELLAAPIALAPNPTGLAPLTALARIETLEKTTVEITVDGPAPLTYTFDDSLVAVHNLPVAGLYPGQDNRIVVRLIARNGRYARDTLELAAPPLPEFMPTVQIETADLQRMEPGLNVCELNIAGRGPYQTFPIAFDHNGAIRWYLDLSWMGGWMAPFEPLRNGNFLCGYGSRLYEIDALGRILNSWLFPGYYQHHDAVEKPDGNFIVPVTKGGENTGLDHVIEVARDCTGVLREWDLRSELDVDRYDLLYSPNDWLHVN